MDATNLADLYHLPLLDWSGIETRLRAGLSQAPGAGGQTATPGWLATLNPDGSPHVTGVGATVGGRLLLVRDRHGHPQGQEPRP